MKYLIRASLVVSMVAFLITGFAMAMSPEEEGCYRHGLAVARITNDANLGLEAYILCCEFEGCG